MPQSRPFALLNASLSVPYGQGRAPQAQRPRVRDLRRRGLLVRAAARVGAKQREQLRWGVWTDDKWQVAGLRSGGARGAQGAAQRRQLRQCAGGGGAAGARAAGQCGAAQPVDSRATTHRCAPSTHCCIPCCLVPSHAHPCLTGAKSEVSSAALGELPINLFGTVMPASAPARAAAAADEAACNCGRPRVAARCLCELHRAHEGLRHGGLQHVVPC